MHNQPHTTTAPTGAKLPRKILVPHDAFAEVPQNDSWTTACAVWYTDFGKAKAKLTMMTPDDWIAYWNNEGRHLGKITRHIPSEYLGCVRIEHYLPRTVHIPASDTIHLFRLGETQPPSRSWTRPGYYDEPSWVWRGDSGPSGL